MQVCKGFSRSQRNNYCGIQIDKNIDFQSGSFRAISSFILFIDNGSVRDVIPPNTRTHTYTCTYTHAHSCTCTHTYTQEVISFFPTPFLFVSTFYWFYLQNISEIRPPFTSVIRNQENNKQRDVKKGSFMTGIWFVEGRCCEGGKKNYGGWGNNR